MKPISEIENISVPEIIKIIKSINYRKSLEDRKIFEKIFKSISEKKILTIIKENT